MALNKQNVHLDLKGGLDQKLDNRLIIPSKLANLRDAVFDDATPQTYGSGTVVRRGGLTSHALTTLDAAGAAVVLPVRTWAHKGSALVESSAGLHRIVKDTGQTLVDGQFRRASLETEPISIPTRPLRDDLTAPTVGGEYDVAYTATKTRSCWVWTQYNVGDASRGALSVMYKLVDEASGGTIYQGELYSTSIQSHPRVIYVSSSDKFFIYYGKYLGGATTFTIEVVSLTASSTLTIGSAQTVYTSTDHTPNYIGTTGHELLFDVVTSGSTVFFVARDPANTLKYKLLSASDGYTASASTTVTASASVPNLSIAICSGVNLPYMAVWGKSGGALRGVAWDGIMLSSLETALNTPAGSGSLGRITTYYASSTTSLYVVYDSSASGVLGNPKTSIVDMTAITITAEGSIPASQWLVAGRLVFSAGNSILIPLMNTSDTQPTFYLVRAFDTASRIQVHARVDYGECGYTKRDWDATARVPDVFAYSSVVYFGYPKWVSEAQLVAGKYIQPYIINRAAVDFAGKLVDAQVNGLTYLAGACPQLYDGVNVVEEGFHHAPEIVSIAAVASGGTFVALPAGTYYITLTVGWQDAQGNWHESAPAEPMSVTTTGGLPDALPVYMVPPTSKAGVQYLWYRTVAAGASTGPFYRAFGLDTTTITSDATLVQGEQLYTSPGVAGQALPHDPMPSCRHIEQHQDRLFLSGCEDGYTVFYSNQTYEGRAAEFSVLLQKRTDYEFGRVVGTQSQDGKLYVLGERKIGVLLGQGPTDTGEQDGYSDIEVIVHDTGAKWGAPKSIATTNDGVWFQSNNNGIRLLSRNGAMAQAEDGRFVGSEVDAQLGTNYTVNATLIGESTRQVRFYHSGGGVLVYDNQWRQWSRFSNHTHVDACYADGRFYHVTSTPKLLYYNESVHTDDGTAITMYLLTPWLSFAGIQGFQRVYKAMFLGGPLPESPSNTQVVTLYVAYNYDGNSFVTAINAADATASSVGMTQFEHAFTTQKCESVQLWLEVKSKTDAARFRLSDILLQVGLKPGKFKLPAARRL